MDSVSFLGQQNAIRNLTVNQRSPISTESQKECVSISIIASQEAQCSL